MRASGRISFSRQSCPSTRQSPFASSETTRSESSHGGPSSHSSAVDAFSPEFKNRTRPVAHISGMISSHSSCGMRKRCTEALNFGLLGVPVGPFGRAAGEVGEDPARRRPRSARRAARPQPQRLELAPLPVSAPLAMRRLDHDLADGRGFDRCRSRKRFPARGARRRWTAGSWASDCRTCVQPGLPIGRGDRSGGRGRGRGRRRRLEEVARAVVVVGEDRPRRAADAVRRRRGERGPP